MDKVRKVWQNCRTLIISTLAKKPPSPRATVQQDGFNFYKTYRSCTTAERLAQQYGVSKATIERGEVAAAQEMFEQAEANKEPRKRGRKPKESNSTKFVEIGSTNANENILRCLARDHEDIFTKVKSGELTVNQAAIQAGIRNHLNPVMPSVHVSASILPIFPLSHFPSAISSTFTNPSVHLCLCRTSFGDAKPPGRPLKKANEYWHFLRLSTLRK